MKKQEIYLDHASTTYINPQVLKAMLPYFTEYYGNPESRHKKGKQAKIAIDKAKETISKILNCLENEIIFTGSGTQANNLAILGFAKTLQNKKHFITSEIEHSSILEPFKELKKQGHKITYIKPDKYGIISQEIFQKAITKETVFSSIQYANNEIGTIQPIKEIGNICKKNNIIFHTDACQAGQELLDTKKLNIDLMTLNGSKIYGPKGIGLLFINKKIQLNPIFYGGDQEKKLFPGTHNTPNIIGLAEALKIIQKEKAKEKIHLKTLQQKLIKQLLLHLPNSFLNGHPEKRISNNISITIPKINAEELLLHLDEAGIFASTGAACATGKSAPSHVLKSIGLKENHIHSTIRFTLGKKTTEKNINYVIKTLFFILNEIS